MVLGFGNMLILPLKRSIFSLLALLAMEILGEFHFRFIPVFFWSGTAVFGVRYTRIRASLPNWIGACKRGTAWDRLNLGSNESQYKILNPHIPQGRVYERILTKNGAKNEVKSCIFEYLATPKTNILIWQKNLFCSFLTTSESELLKWMPIMS